MTTTTETPREAPLVEEAHRRGLSYNQLLRLVLLGKVPGRKVGHRWMVTVQNVPPRAA